MEKVLQNNDLLEKILLRLPAEIVHGFIPVSKRWYNLISSQTFRQRHSSYHLHLPPSSSKILMLPQRNRSAITLLHLCNGVATTIKTSNTENLLTDNSYDGVECAIRDVYQGLFLFFLRIRNRKESHYWVCNPLTKEYKVLPLIDVTFNQVAFALTSKPNDRCRVIGASYTDTEIVVRVYSSESDTWKILGQFTLPGLFISKSIVWDNCLFLFSHHHGFGTVSVVDLEKQCVSHPSSLLSIFVESSKFLSSVDYFGESGGCLYAVQFIKYDPQRRENNYRLWELKDVNESWKEKFEFQIEEGSDIFFVHKEGEEVWLLLVRNTYSCLNYRKIYYCLNGNTKDLEEVDVRYWRQIIRSYTPTLFPLGG